MLKNKDAHTNIDFQACFLLKYSTSIDICTCFNNSLHLFQVFVVIMQRRAVAKDDNPFLCI